MGLRVKRIPKGFFGFASDIDIVKNGKKKTKEEKERDKKVKLGAKRARQLRKMKGEEVMFGAKADREEQKARLRIAKRAGRKGSSTKIGRRKKRKRGFRLF